MTPFPSGKTGKNAVTKWQKNEKKKKKLYHEPLKNKNNNNNTNNNNNNNLTIKHCDRTKVKTITVKISKNSKKNLSENCKK